MFHLTEGTFGKRAIADSAWSEEMTDYLLANEIVELELNHEKGWKGTDLSLLGKVAASKVPKDNRLRNAHQLTRSIFCMSFDRSKL